MQRGIAIICPTYIRATFEWKWFLKHFADAIKKANRSNLSIELTTGYKIKYVVGPREVKGLNCNIVSIDEFELGLFGGKYGRTDNDS